MDFRKIEYFLTVAKYLNFSRASEEIHISHQVLSKQIRLLEDELGTVLFERSTTKVALTEVGKRLYDSFEPIVDNAYKEYENLEKFIQLRKSNLSLGYFNALSYNQIIDPIVQFLKKYKPSLSIDVYAGDVGDVRDKLIKDKIDLLISVTTDPDAWQDLQVISLDQVPLQVMISSRHPLYNIDRELTEEDLKKEKLLYYKSGDTHFMEHIKVKERIPIQNYDDYINRLYKGEEIGVISDIYSQREGDFRLLDLPVQYRKDLHLLAAFKKEHPLKDLLLKLKKY